MIDINCRHYVASQGRLDHPVDMLHVPVHIVCRHTDMYNVHATRRQAPQCNCTM